MTPGEASGQIIVVCTAILCVVFILKHFVSIVQTVLALALAVHCEERPEVFVFLLLLFGFVPASSWVLPYTGGLLVVDATVVFSTLYNGKANMHMALLFTAAWLAPSLTTLAYVVGEVHGFRGQFVQLLAQPNSGPLWAWAFVALAAASMSPSPATVIFVELVLLLCLAIWRQYLLSPAQVSLVVGKVSSTARVVGYVAGGELKQPTGNEAPLFSLDAATFPFQWGAMRAAHHMLISDPGTLPRFPDLAWMLNSRDGLVLKQYYVFRHDASQLSNLYKEDLYMQYAAKKYGDLYNTQNPPRRMNFVHAAIIQIDDRQFWIEPRLDGTYRKFSNNAGWTDTSRNTPHAFSHFCYEKSNHEIVVVDLQGVDDHFTDPQIHADLPVWKQLLWFVKSDARRKYGAGNFGSDGIALWKATHTCNDLCRWLGLPPLTAAAQRPQRVLPPRAPETATAARLRRFASSAQAGWQSRLSFSSVTAS